MGNDSSENPIFVAMSEIDCHDNTFTKADKKGFITLVPKNSTLHGYRCSDIQIEGSKLEWEACGTIEPDKWLSRLVVRFKTGREVKLSRLDGRVAHDKFDRLRQPVRCIALIAEDNGSYRVVGSRHTTVEFLQGGLWDECLNAITNIELASYQPRPYVYCHVPVSVTDCTSDELADLLMDCISYGK